MGGDFTGDALLDIVTAVIHGVGWIGEFYLRKCRAIPDARYIYVGYTMYILLCILRIVVNRQEQGYEGSDGQVGQ